MRTIRFHRPPREYPEALPTEPIRLAGPPAPYQPQRGAGQWMRFLLPLCGILGAVVFVVISHNPLMLISSGAMMLASVGGGIATNASQQRTQKRRSHEHEQRYRDYLNERRHFLETLVARQQAAQQWRDPTPTQLTDRATMHLRRWERRVTDDDFLRVRVGRGDQPLCAPVQLDGRENPLAEPTPLQQAADALVQEFAAVPDAPITVDLAAGGVVAICAPTGQGRALARAILCQIAAWHAPNDVRMLASFPPAATPEWSWLKWLPHTRCLQATAPVQGTETLCMLAYRADEFGDLLETQVVPVLAQRRRLRTSREAHQNGAPFLPHIVLVLDDFAPQSALAHLPAMRELLAGSDDLGITVICLVTRHDDEPSTARLRLVETGSGLITAIDLRPGMQQQAGIIPEGMAVETCDALARQLAPLLLTTETQAQDLEANVPLLQLLGISSPHLVKSDEIWQSRLPSDLLRVPIGTSAKGTTLLLDLKESAEGGMGPHGLIIGATGSGKSELLRTIITSLALTHDPEVLNFVLADFKGGASFAEFLPLPHVAGMITNLQSDLSLISRMRAALSGEQERRQRVLRDAGNLANIRQYHAARARDRSLPPLPYLAVIIDEFAELLANQPDFLDLFIAIGRVGRSLGMHLLLATQRLEEGRIQGLEGHLRYRICLRTFSAQESTAVLGTPDAFSLPPYPGVGYFKVDTTIYERFKSAIVSLPALAADHRTDMAPVVREFTATGKLFDWHMAKSEHQSNAIESAASSDMEIVVKKLAHPQRSYGVHQVWLPPLGTSVPLGSVLSASPSQPLTIPIGILDDPQRQRQITMTLDLAGAQGHVVIVGAPQSGKSTLLHTIIAAFMLTHAPSAVQIYVIDMGGGTLSRFEAVPHVGTIAYKGEREKVRRLVRQMRSIIEEREIVFRTHRIDGIAAYRARRLAGEFADHPFAPDVFLIIDDIGQLQGEIDQIDVEIMDLAATGLTYGVHLILTAGRWADVRLKLRDHIGMRMELRLNDPAETEMGRAAAMAIAHAAPGRGISKSGLQFQVALPLLDQATSVERCIVEQQDRWRDQAAPPLRLLPDIVLPQDPAFGRTMTGAAIPLGIDEFRLEAVALDLHSAGPHFLVLGDAECGKTTLLRTWMRGLMQHYTPEQIRLSIVDYRRMLVEFAEFPHVLSYAFVPTLLKDCIDQVRTAVEPRLLRGANLSLADLRNAGRWQGPHHYVIIDDYDMLTTSGPHPLATFADLVLQARDIGLHVILARRVGGIGRAATDPILQRLRELGTPGIVMNGDPQEGLIIGAQRAAPQPPGRGFLVRRNQRTFLIQTIYTAPEAVESSSKVREEA